MLRAIVVFTAAAALTMALVAKLVRAGAPYFERPSTIIDHITPADDPVRTLPSLLPPIASVIPPRATVACFMPVDGKLHDDYCSLAATAYLLRQRVTPIDDADIAVGCGFFVGDNAVDLVRFQRCWVAAVVNADGEGRACLASFHGYSSKYLLRLNSLKARARARRWSAPARG